MALTGERRVLLGLTLTACVAIGVGFASFQSVSRLRDEGFWITQTQEIISTLEVVLFTATDAETSGRGYAITGDDAHLEPYTAAVEKNRSTTTRLSQLVSNDSNQSQLASELTALVVQRIELVRLLVDVRRVYGFEAAREFVVSEKGELVHDAIRRKVDEMTAVERLRLQKRLASSKKRTQLTLVAVAAGCLLSIGIAVLAIYLIRRDYAGSRRAQAEFRTANDLLDKHVAERTAELQGAHKQLQLAEAVLKNTQESIVVTTPDCCIVTINPAFSRVTEYQADEVIGRHMRIVQSGKHAPSFFQQMWESVHTTGAWQGEIWNRRRSGDIYQEWLAISTIKSASGEPIYYIGVATDLSRINHAKTHLEFLAHHDALTGLPNRLLLGSRLAHTLERAQRDMTMFAVLLLDLDRFKAVNDTWGHKAGDQLLKLVAERLLQRLRDIDTLARLGGDEFVVVLESIGSPQEATEVANALTEQFCVPFVLSGGHDVSIGISVGISLYPGDGGNSDQLLEKADAALYAAKEAGRGTWRTSGYGQGLLKDF